MKYKFDGCVVGSPGKDGVPGQDGAPGQKGQKGDLGGPPGKLL